MSGKLAKAERREVRRILGDEGVMLLDEHSEGLLKIAEVVEALQGRVGVLAGQLGKVAQLQDSFARLQRQMEWFDRLSFWQRLRWLVTGR